MKKLKKLAALVLAAAMVLAMGMTSFAAETGTITINNTGGYAAEGVTFKAYKVFDVTTNASGGYGYAMTEQVKEFFAGLEHSITTDDAAYEYVKDNAGAFRDALAKAIAADTTGSTYTAAATATSVGAMSPEVGYGFYIIVPTKDNQLYTEISPNLVYVGENAGTVELKGKKPTVEKKVNDEDYTNGKVGDELTFTLTSKVPDMSSYNPATYVFRFVDTLSKGLKVDINSVEVKIDNAVYSNVEKETTPNPATGKEATTLKITLNGLASSNAVEVGDSIVVTYKATITDAVEITTNDATNTVDIEYGKDGATEEGGEDTTHTYLYHMEILKTDEADQPLAGAEFQIFNANEDGTTVAGTALQLVQVSAGDDTNPAVYRPALTTETGVQTQTVITPASGKVIIRGLEAGKYFARETKAPDGYNRLKEDTPVTIAPMVTNNGATITYPGEENKVTIENHKGSLLPDTGGMGTVIFTVIGLVLILGVGASFVISRKKRA